MHCEVTLGEWHDSDKLMIGDIVFERGKATILKPDQMTYEIVSNIDLEFAWKYTEDELNKCSTPKLRHILWLVFNTRETMYQRRVIINNILLQLRGANANRAAEAVNEVFSGYEGRQ